MKKFFLFAFLFGISGFLLSAKVSAYTPTDYDLLQLQALKTQLNEIISWNNYDTWSFYLQIKTLITQFSWDEQLNYLLSDLNVHLINKLTVEKTKAKVESKDFKQEFLDTYLTGPIDEIEDERSCTGWYNTLDNISFANNFPTALTVATRYREANCGYYLPSNGDGPFQIVNKDYGTGEITEEIFVQSVQDFIDFSKAKHLQYKTALWITMSYTGFDYTGLINHAGLYNGWLISGDMVVPNTPWYVFDGYGTEYTGALRYGLFPKFLKSLEWELVNQY